MTTSTGAPPIPVASALGLMARDIKLAHSVFALPFALLGAFLARDPMAAWSAFAGQLILVVLCMVLARTWAMLVNRLLDRRIDAANPRTKRRAFASGALDPRRGWTAAIACAILFIVCTSAYLLLFGNPWPVMLAAPVLAWIAFYSLTKRFTALCHVVLGVALALSPVAAALAIRPHALMELPGLWCLAAMVALWVAGFDVIYALQDLEFDRAAGLRSIPAALGWRGALWASRVLHLGSAAFLVAVWALTPRLDVPFGVGAAVTLGLLVTEHVVVARSGRKGLDMAFFTLNGVVSCVLGAVGIVDTLI